MPATLLYSCLVWSGPAVLRSPRVSLFVHASLTGLHCMPCLCSANKSWYTDDVIDEMVVSVSVSVTDAVLMQPCKAVCLHSIQQRHMRPVCLHSSHSSLSGMLSASLLISSLLFSSDLSWSVLFSHPPTLPAAVTISTNTPHWNTRSAHSNDSLFFTSGVLWSSS